MRPTSVTIPSSRSTGRRPRRRRVWSAVFCAAGLWTLAAAAQAAPARPTLAQFPLVSLPRPEALSLPDQVQETSENLPFEVILPDDRPKYEKKTKGSVINYDQYQHWLTLKARERDVCLRSNGASMARSEDRDRLEFYNYAGQPEQIRSVRSERLELHTRPELVVEDFFVSPRAGHARHASTTRVPLVKVADMGEGLAVYAYREPHRLSLVLSAPEAAMIMPNASAVRLGCGVSRVSIETSGRSGVATSFALGVPERKAPEDVGDFRAWAQVPLQRAWRVSVSVSQTSRDPAPVLSLTFGDPSRPVRDALKAQMPRWNEVIGPERAREIELELSKRR
ncbi:MAG TPA: hypothetical protein VFU02_01925 [Polyangiaceae bacterium]|nr:hypothetical protein [Polyangiaceae bacterium]